MCMRNNFRVIRALEMFHIKRIGHKGEGQCVTSFFSLLKVEILMTISNQVKRRKIEEEKLIASSLAFMMSCTDKMRFCVYRQWIKCMWFWTPNRWECKISCHHLFWPTRKKSFVLFCFFNIPFFAILLHNILCKQASKPEVPSFSIKFPSKPQIEKSIRFIKHL